MKNFIFKSTAADLQKMFQLLNTIQSNVLYLTWNVDKIRKDVTSMITNKGLQTQVDDFYEQSPDKATGRDESID